MADYEKAMGLVDAIEARKAEAGAPRQERPSFGQNFVSGLRRGAVASPAAAMDLANFAGVGDPSETQLQRASLQRLSGQPAPETLEGRIGERMGTGIPFAVAGLPFAAAQGPKLVASEIAASILSPTLGQFSEELGASPGVQFGVEAGTGFLLPPFSGAAGVSRLARRATGRVGEIARETGSSPFAVRRLGKELRGDLPVDETGQPMTEELVKDLRRAALGPKGRRLTTAQAAGKRGGSRLMKREAAAVRSDREFERWNAGRQIRLEEYLEQKWNQLLPNADPDEVKRIATSIRESMDTRARGLWQEVAELKQVPDVDIQRVKQAAQRIVGSRKRTVNRLIPSEVLEILEMPDKIPASELHDFTSDTLRTVREFSKGTSPGSERVKAAKLRPLVDALQQEIREMPGAGSDAYRAARNATREFYETFPEYSKAVDAVLDIDEPMQMARKLRSIRGDIDGEISRVLKIVDQKDGGRDALRRAMIDSLWDESLGNRPIRSVVRDLRQNKKVYKAVLGEDGYRQQVEIADEWRKATAFVTANQGVYRQTGSGLNEAKVPGMIRNMRNIASVSGAMNAASNVLDRFLLAMDDARFGSKLVREMQLDPGVAADLIEAADPQNIERVIGAMDKLLGRVMARSRVMGVSGLRVAANAGDERNPIEVQSSPQISIPAPQNGRN